MTTDEIRALSGLELRRAVAESLGWKDRGQSNGGTELLGELPPMRGIMHLAHYEQSVDAALGLFALGVEVTINHEVRLDDNTWCWAVDADGAETEFGEDTLSGLATALCRTWLIARLPA